MTKQRIENQMKRLVVRLRKMTRSTKSIMSNEIKMDEVQHNAFRICRKMICDSKSELIHAPISHVYYIENDHYYIRFSSGSVTITNGKFSYYVWLPEKATDELKKIFSRVSQSKSNRLEQRYEETTLENLKEISKTIDNAQSSSNN
jgi:hypothetical protein